MFTRKPIDIQVFLDHVVIDVVDEMGPFKWELTLAEFNNLASEVADASATIHRGRQRMSLRADCIEPGDQIMGMKVMLRYRLGPKGICFRFHFPRENDSMVFPEHRVIEIERPIQ